MSLLLTVFLIVFVTQLISWIGTNVLLDYAFSLYLSVTRSDVASRQRALKSEVLKNKTELLRTSAQDHFAKWAKLRRSVDKGLADLEKLNSESASLKTAFSVKFKATIWFLTTGVQFIITWWYRRQPVFYLPPGWFGPLTWWLALPSAPKGSVSVGVWSLACKRALGVLERVVKSHLEARAEAVKTSPVPSGVTTPNNEKATSSSATPVKSPSSAPTESTLRSRKATVESASEDDS